MKTLAALLVALFSLTLLPDAAYAERRPGFRINLGFLSPSRARRARIKQIRKARRAAARRKARRSVRRSARRPSRQARRVARRPNRANAGRSTRKASSRNFARTTVPYRTKQKAGTIVIETRTRHLYYVLSGGRAIRYGVAVGRDGFAWSGTSRVRRKVEWPTWTPPAEMIARDPELARFAGGMPGGPQNPLGARALYLFQGKQDTLYRIHGTNDPGSIGSAASSGCIRMRNADVAHLYSKVRMGAKVIVR